jgi:4-amino-4-deoxy-L-arabinose transferase-like glycosyltransferase
MGTGTDRAGGGKRGWGHRRAAAGVAIVFLGVNAALAASYGVREGGDSGRYLAGAESLARGQALEGKAAAYPGYAALVAAGLGAWGSRVGVAAVQIALAAAATLALYDLGQSLRGRRTGLIAAALHAGNPDVMRWNVYILTDAVYISLVILAAWAIHKSGERRGVWIPLAALTIAAAGLVRPTGWFLIAAAGVFWVIILIKNPRIRGLGVLAVIVMSALVVWALPPVRQAAGSEGLGGMFLKGEVVWGFEDWRLPMPSVEQDEGGAESLPELLVRHPMAGLRLAGARVLAELGHIRPFHSNLHNACILIFLVPVYGLALAGYLRTRRLPLSGLLAMIITAHLAVIAVTFADWDGRFLLHILPLVVLFAAGEAARLTGEGQRERAGAR